MLINILSTIDTANPYKILRNEEEKLGFALDFQVAVVETLCESYNPPLRKIYAKEELDLFNSDSFFTNTFEKITQKFTINLYRKEKKENQFFISLISNNDLTDLKVKLSFENLIYNENLEQEILQEIYKTMIKKNFLLHIRTNKEFLPSLKAFLQNVKNNTIDANIKENEIVFDLAKGVDYEKTVIDKAIYHKKLCDEVTFDGKKAIWDEKKFCSPIKKDELLFEYIFKKQGKMGRNLKGETLIPDPIKLLGNPFLLEDDSIYSKELDDRIQYYSNSYGFLTCTNKKTFLVSSSLKIDQVSFKNTGSIKTDLNEMIDIDVFNADRVDDGVKSGISKIEANRVNIRSNIGDTTIKAKIVNIEGATHTNSEIYTHMASINTLKGYLEAEDIVYIKNLEHGKISAKIVFVDRATNAEIEADYIYVKELIYGNKIYPKKALFVDYSMGDNNLININPCPKFKKDQEYNKLQNLYEQINKKLELVMENMNSIYDYVVKNQEKILILKRNFNEHVKNISHINLKQTYQTALQRYESLLKKYQQYITLKHKIKLKLKIYEEMVFKAKIYTELTFIGENNILQFDVSKLENLPLRYHLGTQDMGHKVFSLNFNDNLHITHARKYDEDEIDWVKAEKNRLENSLK